jgi:hypothetical protein
MSGCDRAEPAGLRSLRRLRFGETPEADTDPDFDGLAGLALPDPADRHVVAGAVAAQSALIVTRNTRDFPGPALAPYGLKAGPPDQLLLRLFETSPVQVLDALGAMAAQAKNPPLTVSRVLESLARSGAEGFARAVSAFLAG